MKRFLAWIVLILCNILSLVIINIVEVLAFNLATYVHNLSSFLFWVIILLGGTFGAVLVFTITYASAGLSIAASQGVERSKKGARYIAVGVMVIVLYGFSLILTVVGFLEVGDTLVNIIFNISAIIYGCVVIYFGREKVEEDGEPLTQQEKKQLKIENQKLLHRTTNTITIADNLLTQEQMEQLRNWKKLLDENIISQDEFETKKKEILNM